MCVSLLLCPAAGAASGDHPPGHGPRPAGLRGAERQASGVQATAVPSVGSDCGQASKD